MVAFMYGAIGLQHLSKNRKYMNDKMLDCVKLIAVHVTRCL